MPIDNALWKIERYMMKKYGCDVASRNIYPLRWYIKTGRSSVDFDKEVCAANPYYLARILMSGGSHDEVLSKIKKYIYRRENKRNQNNQ